MSIEFDPTVLFEQVNQWITTFLPILAIGGGITIAIALVALIINSVVKGVKGGTGK